MLMKTHIPAPHAGMSARLCCSALMLLTTLYTGGVPRKITKKYHRFLHCTQAHKLGKHETTVLSSKGVHNTEKAKDYNCCSTWHKS